MGKIQHQFSTDGFAIWLTGNNNEHDFDVHINEWIIPKDKNYIDIGIRLYDITQINSCSIFIPYLVSNNDITDLGYTLSNEKIARGIFNANCSIKTSSTSSIIEINYNERNENIICLNAISPIIQSINNGTLINLPFTPILPMLTSNEAYIRFRIPHKTLDAFFQLKHHSYKFQFESPIATERYNYVIKINEVRSLPLEIRSMFHESNQNLKKVIVTLSANENYIVDDSTCYKMRHLESDLYENYVPSNFSCEKVIVYQWLVSNKKHYNFNIKIDYSNIMWDSLLIYALLLTLFSFMGNFLWKLLTLIPCLEWLK